jgi:hypothetical protein
MSHTHRVPKSLLAVGTNIKTIKSDKASEYLTAIMYLAPAKQNTKGVNLCPKASQGCLQACLYTAGRGKFSNVQAARVNKSDYFVADRPAFLLQLHKDIAKHIKKCKALDKKPAVRLNGTSDILWERYIDMSLYPEVQFYDYTKWSPWDRVKVEDIPNYHLTFSRAEDTPDSVVRRIMRSKNVNMSVVFSGKDLPETYLGFPVFNGDLTDLRFLDPAGHIIGLSAKGEGKKDTSGFVIHQEAV